jgi:hypothetical protein
MKVIKADNRTIRQKLIEAGVKNLQRFGYPDCNAENILTDYVYKQFFLSMLNDNISRDKKIDEEIEKLKKEIEKK